MEEWEKNTQNLKTVFEGPPTRRKKRPKRNVQSARDRSNNKSVSFYLT